MQFKDGSKLRRYIFMQQLLIGIVQTLLAVALLTRNSKRDTWIAGVTGSMNFVFSMILVGYFGVGLYPRGVSFKIPQAMLTIAISFAVNFGALCIILSMNQDDDLSSILSFGVDGTAAKAFALFFFITVYVTLLMGIGFGTYCLIDISDEATLPKNDPDMGDGGPRNHFADPRRNQTVMKEPNLAEELVEVRVPAPKVPAKRTSVHQQGRNVDFNTRRQSFRSSMPREIHVRQMPPTPPPEPVYNLRDAAKMSAKRQAQTVNLKEQIRNYRRSSQ